MRVIRRLWQTVRNLHPAAQTGLALLVVGALSLGAWGALETRDTETPSSAAIAQAGQSKQPAQAEKPVTKSAPPPREPIREFAAAPTWVQDFTAMPDGPVDEAVWHHEDNPDVPGYNGESQAYRKENVFIQGGRLVIMARREPYIYPNDPEKRQFAYTSARIDTRNSHSFEYGKFEATVKLPKGNGTWPAFWFLSANQVHTAKHNPTESDWGQERFYMHDGELDAMEGYGHLPGVIEGTLYTFNKTYEGVISVPNASDTFHTYGVEVTPAKVTWTIDGKPFYSVTKPSDRPEDWPFGNGNRLYAIFNLALGGSGGGPIDDSMHKHWVMEVRSAKYYPYTGS